MPTKKNIKTNMLGVGEFGGGGQQEQGSGGLTGTREGIHIVHDRGRWVWRLGGGVEDIALSYAMCRAPPFCFYKYDLNFVCRQVRAC